MPGFEEAGLWKREIGFLPGSCQVLRRWGAGKEKSDFFWTLDKIKMALYGILIFAGCPTARTDMSVGKCLRTKI